MCTDLLVMSKTKDQVVNARSQEFDQRVGYRVIMRKKGVKVQITMPTATPEGSASLAEPKLVELCTSKHNYIGLMMTTLTKDNEPGIPVSTAVFDGMNDAGLSAGGLLFPGSQYQVTQAGTDNVFVGFLSIGC